MNKKIIQTTLLLILIITMLLTFCGCGNKNNTVATTSPPIDETVIAEPLSPSMSRYQEAAKQNILLLAQEQHLNLEIQYYSSIEMSDSADRFQQKSFEEEVFGSKKITESEILIDYPAYNPDSIEITIPYISEEDAESKASELEIQNEELKKTISDMQQVLDNYKSIYGL